MIKTTQVRRKYDILTALLKKSIFLLEYSYRTIYRAFCFDSLGRVSMVSVAAWSFFSCISAYLRPTLWALCSLDVGPFGAHSPRAIRHAFPQRQ